MIRSAALPRSARLQSAAQFVGQFPQRYNGTWYQVLARSGTGAANGARLGLIVGRRAAPRAVDRALAKRLAREVFRCTRTTLPPLDVVIRLKSVINDGQRAAARAELAALLGRLK